MPDAANFFLSFVDITSKKIMYIYIKNSKKKNYEIWSYLWKIYNDFFQLAMNFKYLLVLIQENQSDQTLHPSNPKDLEDHYIV